MKVFLGRLERFYHKFENGLAALFLFIMALIPTYEVIVRNILQRLQTLFHGSVATGLQGSVIYVQNLTLWVGFIGAIVAARDDRHLTLAPTINYLPEKLKKPAVLFKNAVTVGVCTGLFIASWMMVKAMMADENKLAGFIPTWAIQSILPIAFFIMAVRFTFGLNKTLRDKLITLSGAVVVALMSFIPDAAASAFVIPCAVILVIAVVLGAPIFTVLGGLGLLLFFGQNTPIASVPAETYRIVSSTILPTIPLFTLAGYILAEGGASKRFIRLFNAWFGWMPGGLAIAAILVCTFFTTFTGASGVTILAMGGLLYPILVNSGYSKKFTIGLLTATGSLGLLFPPSLPVILYGVQSRTNILDLFKAGILPGVILVLFVTGFAVYEGAKSKVKAYPFKHKEAFNALWETKWEAVIPLLVLYLLFGGVATVVEAAAITAIYAFIVEVFIYKDIHITRDMPKVLLKCTILVGGVLTILGCAMGFTNYIVDAEIPMKIADWTFAHVHSQILFLLILNLVLLVVGCLMDIFSAIVVVVPLLLPIAQKFGVSPVHLGIIFIANLELGYLTPPVGMNLFLSAYRFEKTVGEVTRSSFKFLLLLLIAVILITYAPFLTEGVVAIWK
jgi:C4-dicarboxylate transporter, DctM subunit